MPTGEKFLVFECYEDGAQFLISSAQIFAGEQELCERLEIPYTQHLFDHDLELDGRAIDLLCTAFGLSAGPACSWCILRRPKSFDLLPYRIHTNREFELMVRGVKPLSVFYEHALASQHLMDAIAKKFEAEVDAKRLLERRYTQVRSIAAGRNDAVNTILYARPAEEWRIDAYISMMACADQSGWNEGFERLQGSLLGYESWQTDAHLQSQGLERSEAPGNNR